MAQSSRYLPEVTREDLISLYTRKTEEFISVELTALSLVPECMIETYIDLLPERIRTFVQGIINEKKLDTPMLAAVRAGYLTRVRRKLGEDAKLYTIKRQSPIDHTIGKKLEELTNTVC